MTHRNRESGGKDEQFNAHSIPEILDLNEEEIRRLPADRLKRLHQRLLEGQQEENFRKLQPKITEHLSLVTAAYEAQTGTALPHTIEVPTPPSIEEDKEPTPKTEQRVALDYIQEVLADLPSDLKTQFADNVKRLEQLRHKLTSGALTEQDNKYLWTNLVNLFKERCEADPRGSSKLAHSLSECYGSEIKTMPKITLSSNAHLLGLIALADSPAAAEDLIELISVEMQEEGLEITGTKQPATLDDLRQRVYSDAIRRAQREAKTVGKTLPDFSPKVSAEDFADKLAGVHAAWKGLAGVAPETANPVTDEAIKSESAVATTPVVETPPATPVPQESEPSVDVIHETVTAGQPVEVISPEPTPKSPESAAEPAPDAKPESPAEEARRIIQDILSHKEELASIVDLGKLENWAASLERGEAIHEEFIWEDLAIAYSQVASHFIRSDAPDRVEPSFLNNFTRILGRQAEINLNINSPTDSLRLAQLSYLQSPESVQSILDRLQQRTADPAIRLDDGQGNDLTWEGFLKVMDDEQMRILDAERDRQSAGRPADERLPAILEEDFDPAHALERRQAAVKYWRELKSIATPEAVSPRPEATPETKPETPTEPAREWKELDSEKMAELETQLEAKRKAFALSLRRRSKVFGSTSEQEVNEAYAEYSSLLTQWNQASLANARAELSGIDLTTPQGLAAVKTAAVEHVLEWKQYELSRLNEALADPATLTRFEKLRGIWLRYSTARLAVAGGSLALGFLGLGAVLSGAGAVGAAFIGARAAYSGFSGFMGTDAGWQKFRDKFGATRKLSADEIKKLDPSELRDMVSAHAFRAADRQQKFGEISRGLNPFRQSLDKTGTAVLDEYLGRQKTEMIAQVEKGGNIDDILAAALETSLAEEKESQTAYLRRRETDRKDARRKFAVSVVVGLAMGASSFASSTGHGVKSLFEKFSGHGHPTAPGDTGTGLEPVSPHGASPDTGHVGGDTPSPVDLRETGGTAGWHPPETYPSGTDTPELYPHQMQDAIIMKGEGIEHALRRQLEGMPEKFGYHGDPNDHAAVHEWSGGEAHRLALRNDFVQPDGTETRLYYQPDTHVVLHADGSVQLENAEQYSYTPEPAPTVEVTPMPEPEIPDSVPDADIPVDLTAHADTATQAATNAHDATPATADAHVPGPQEIPSAPTEVAPDPVSPADVAHGDGPAAEHPADAVGSIDLHDQKQLYAAVSGTWKKMDRLMGADNSHLAIKELEPKRIADLSRVGVIADVIQRHNGSAEDALKVESLMRKYFAEVTGKLFQSNQTYKEAMQAVQAAIQ